MYCEVALDRGEKRRKEGCCVGGEIEAFGVERDSKIYLSQARKRGGIVVVQCNYCQEGETLLLLSRRKGAGPVQARWTNRRLSPSAHVRTGDRKKAMGP